MSRPGREQGWRVHHGRSGTGDSLTSAEPLRHCYSTFIVPYILIRNRTVELCSQYAQADKADTENFVVLSKLLGKQVEL